MNLKTSRKIFQLSFAEADFRKKIFPEVAVLIVTCWGANVDYLQTKFISLINKIDKPVSKNSEITLIVRI